jgi:hypothetical protein
MEVSDGNYTRGMPPVPIEQASGWNPELVLNALDMRKYLTLTGIEHDLTVVQPVAQSLHRIILANF